MASPSPDTPAALRETLRLAAEGDAEAWRALVQAYTGRVFGLLLKQCRDRDLAEEITQATFVKVAQTLGRRQGYDERGRFEAWLFRVAVNALRDEMRRRGRQATPVDMTPGAVREDGPAAMAGQAGPADQEPQRAAVHAEDVQQLRDAVQTLPEADREVLHLRHTAGLTFAEVAEALEQPIGTVLARHHRALKKLRELLAPKQIDEPSPGMVEGRTRP